MRSLLCLFLPGCLVAVRVDSRPVAGEVVTPSGELYRLPAEVKLRWVPFRRPELVCSAVGYRAVGAPVRLGLGPFALRGPKPVVFSLVPEHGPSGTWSADDVP